MERLHLMLRFFDSDEHLARFLGISTEALHLWKTGRRFPTSAALRLLAVLEHLELHAPDLHAYLVDEARPVARVRHERVKRAPLGKRGHIVVNTYSAAPNVRRVERVSVTTWDDDYWYARTVSRAEWGAGVLPSVDDSSDALDAMTSDQESAYWAALADYEKRTGRVKPD